MKFRLWSKTRPAPAVVALYPVGEDKAKCYHVVVDEGRKRVIGVMAAILAAIHMRSADDLFGGPQDSPRTDKLIAASVQWARMIMDKVDQVCPDENKWRS